MISDYGEGLVDLVPSHPGPLAPLSPALGGGPFNVAIAAARLGAPVTFHSRFSRDAFGEALTQRLIDEGVDVSHLERGPEPTTLALTSLAPDGSASYAFYIEGTADRLARPKAQPTHASVAYFGTCSLALEPAASRYVAVARELAHAGALVTLDPNIRPFFATPEHRARLLELLPSVGLLKLSEEEVGFLGEDALKDVPVVVTTRGGDGLSVTTPELKLTVPAYPVQVADTIGAGDTVMAALLCLAHERGGAAGLAAMTKDEWRAALSRAAKAAALTCSRLGAQPPTREEVEA